jgi:hypothetical protein
VVHTTAFVYTTEGVRAVLNRLSPNGRLVVANGNKVRVLATLKALHASKVPFDRTVSISGKADDPTAPWDRLRLIYQPHGFTEEELAGLPGPQLYTPGSPGDTLFHRLVKEDTAALLSEIEQTHNVDLHPTTDDRPFFLDVFPRRAYLSSDFLQGRPPAGLPSVARRMWNVKLWHLRMLLLVIAVTIVLIGVPILLGARSGVREASKPRLLQDIAYFSLLGLGFMLIEIGLIRKLQLFVGHPGHSLALVLTSVLLFTGLGSLASGPLFESGRMTFRRSAVLTVICSLAALFVIDWALAGLVWLPRPLKMSLAFLVPAAPCFFMGHLFPQGLRSLQATHRNFVPWALGVNAGMSTIGANAAILLAHVLGFHVTTLIGIACYAALNTLPMAWRQAAISTQPH